MFATAKTQPICQYYGMSALARNGHQMFRTFGRECGAVSVGEHAGPCKMETLGHAPDEERCPIARGFNRRLVQVQSAAVQFRATQQESCAGVQGGQS